MFFSPKKILIVFLSLAFFLPAGFCFAALELEYPEIMGFSISEGASIAEYAKYFFNLGIGLAIILAVFAIIGGGIYWLISFGRGKFTDEGKQWVKSGILGFLMVVSSYVIASTINPALTVFNLQNLPIINFINNPRNATDAKPKTVFQELPIGILTETLLTKTTDCYDFDANGDPIYKNIEVDGGSRIDGPTFLNHDRVDCISRMSKALKKKTETIDRLSKKIASLMKTCRCDEEKGCKGKDKCLNEGEGVGAQTTKPEQCKILTDCKKLNCECDDSCEDLCPEGTRDTIEGKNGKTIILDEDIANFKNLFPDADKDSVEELFGCMKPELKIKEYKGLEEFRTKLIVISPVIELDPGPTIDEKTITVINMESWKNLKLIEQFMYLKEKLEKFMKEFQYDLNSLQRAEYILGKCYFAKPYVEFLRIKEGNNEKNESVLINKFINNYSRSPVDISTYCKGYEYANSSCYHSCEKMCPSFTASTVLCYQSCQGCDAYDNCANDDQTCLDNKEICIQGQKSCMDECYNLRQCPNKGPSEDFADFQQCTISCKNKCKENCSKNDTNNISGACEKCIQDNDLSLPCDPVSVYKPTTAESCKNLCENDSSCILDADNREKCLFDYNSAQGCADITIAGDSGNFKNCAEDSFLCQFGSDQQSGYIDVFKDSYALSGKDFSSSFAYKKSDLLKCPDCYEEIKVDPLDINNQTKQVCSEKYPETTKGPSCSYCPECPCATILETMPTSKDSSTCQTSDPSLPGYCAGGKICVNGSCVENNARILDYRVVVGECQEFAYNDDPLTFYCKENWRDDSEEKNEESLGEERFCSKQGEIPVGQTVDDAEAWARQLYIYLYNFIVASNNVYDRIMTIGKETGYCNCNSECGDNTRPCGASCGPDARALMGSDEFGNSVPLLDEFGNPIYECVCETKRLCGGNPCQKMISLINGQKSEKTGCPKNTKIYSISYYYDIVKKRAEQIDIFNNNSLTGRTEILKKLIYSRKAINSCSAAQKEYKGEAKLYSCSRVSDENMPPIIDKNSFTIMANKNKRCNSKGQCSETGTGNFCATSSDCLSSSGGLNKNQAIQNACYGKETGEIYGSKLKLETPLMDNWFCCEKR